MHGATEENEDLESLRPITDTIPDNPQHLGVLKISRAPAAKFLTMLDGVITTLMLSKSDRQEYVHCLEIFSKCSEKYYKMTESFVFRNLRSPLIEDGGFFRFLSLRHSEKEIHALT